MVNSPRATKSTARTQSLQSQKKRSSKKREEEKSPRKRIITYVIVIVLLFSAFYAYQYLQMAQIRASLDQQVRDAEVSNQSDLGFLKGTLSQVREAYPNADNYSADPVFSQPPMAGRIEARTQSIIDQSEQSIKDTRDNTPFMFITDFLMPGAQQSTDDHYRETIRGHISNPEYVEFNAVKLQVDDLVAGVKHCRGEVTDLTYGYTDPVPDAMTKALRSNVINDAAKRHLCP